jgi:S-DNA-T family DNA segregation ATPase FtsK/SpoIIIE
MFNDIHQLNDFISSFKVKAECISFSSIKNANYYDFKLLPGGSVSHLSRLRTEMALFLKEASVPRVEVKSEEGVVRFEFIKASTGDVDLLELSKRTARPDGSLTCLIGEEPNGTPMWIDFANTNHILIAGTTGSGKSALIHTLINNILLYKSAKMFIIDPKHEFKCYAKDGVVAHSSSYESAIEVLTNLISEMERRYNNLEVSYSPIFLVIDEFADLAMQDQGKRIYSLLCRLAQKSRAAKIYIILATQRPSVKIITGDIKANFPCRISLRVASAMDSKVVLDESGGEDLPGRGAALIKYNNKTVRFQVARSK